MANTSPIRYKHVHFLDNAVVNDYAYFKRNLNQALKDGEIMTKKIGMYVLIGLIVIFVLIFMFKIYIVVDPGERAVIFNKATGNLHVTPNEGFSFLVPLIKEPMCTMSRPRPIP